MTIAEALKQPGATMYPGIRRQGWPEGHTLREWEEHLWYYVGGDYRVAPWCPCPDDLTEDDWVVPE